MSTIALDIKEHIATLTIQSPPANALSTTLLKDLAKRFDEIEADGTVKAIILKGDGRFFSAGADIKEFTSLQGASDYEATARNGQELFERIEKFSVPVIAAIHGAALGGGLELAMACHICIVTEYAKLGLTKLNIGKISSFADKQRLSQLVDEDKDY